MNITAFLFFLSGVLLICAGHGFLMVGNNVLGLVHLISGMLQFAAGCMWIKLKKGN